MPISRSNPPTLHAPVGAYHHCNVVEPGSRLLVAAGQIGVGPDGVLIDEPRAQIAQAWRNVRAVVEAAGMTHRDIVKLTVYMVGATHVEFSRDCRNRTIEGERPGSTLIYVAGLAEPNMIIEIDVIAAA
jgi:enamine deaminase RidA (YjgF/YER057c/UK114 family)